MGEFETYVSGRAAELPLYAKARAAARGGRAVHVPASLLDADLLLQRGAVLHAGSCHGALPTGGRRVLHALLTAQEGELVAAPDAGGAFADAAASLLVRRAIADEPAPIIVAVVPEGHANDLWDPKPSADPASPARPWLPHVESGAGAYRAHAEAGYVERAREAFLGEAERYLRRQHGSLELHQARMALRGRLDLVNSARMILANLAAAAGDEGPNEAATGLQIGRLAELCQLGSSEVEALRGSTGSLAEVDAALDGVRELELWLAVHVYESVWLEYAEGGVLLGAAELEHPRYHDLDAYWVQLSALAPVQRRTPSELAASFRYWRSSGEAAYNVDAIDLMGVTGAETIDAASALPLLGLARGGFVTGAAAGAPRGSLLALGLDACRWDWGA